jgi:Zinc carboxypeptidase
LRGNITGHIAYHTFSGVHLRPYVGRPDDALPTQDLRAYKILGERGTELTGYPAVSVFHDFKYDPKQTIKGGAHDWMYDHLGVFSWTTEFWSPQREADPDAYVDWYEFDHPELGKVELGGWDIVNYGFNVPFDRLEEEVAPHSDWALFHLLVSARAGSGMSGSSRAGSTSVRRRGGRTTSRPRIWRRSSG